MFNSLASFLVLNNDNSFGNLFRLTSDIGGYESGGNYFDLNGNASNEATEFANNLIIDHFTGDMFYRIAQAAAIWNTAIDNALASTQGGHSDWFLPNINILKSIWKWTLNRSAPYDYAPFNIGTSSFWSSTLRQDVAGTHFYSAITRGQISNSTSGTSIAFILCRKHF